MMGVLYVEIFVGVKAAAIQLFYSRSSHDMGEHGLFAEHLWRSCIVDHIFLGGRCLMQEPLPQS